MGEAATTGAPSSGQTYAAGPDRVIFLGPNGHRLHRENLFAAVHFNQSGNDRARRDGGFGG
jgi:hypothetical protein